jgi:hypothetical protein
VAFSASIRRSHIRPKRSPSVRTGRTTASIITAAARTASRASTLSAASLYAGDGLVCCLGEFVADSTEITVPGTRVATISPTTDLTLLDLRNTAALDASTTQAIAAISERKTSQAWSRW